MRAINATPRSHTFSRRSVSVLTLASAVAVAVVSGGCAPDASTVKAREVRIDQTSQAMMGNRVSVINGAYSGCVDRGGSWSALVTEGELPNPALSVVQNDTNCTLAATSFVMNGDTYTASSPIPIGADYRETAVAFVSDLGTTTFYGNVRMTPADFSSDFVLTVSYSAYPLRTSGSNGATYSEWQGSADGTAVPSPDYGMTDNLILMTDANAKVTSATGSVDLVFDVDGAEDYVIDDGMLPAWPSFEQIDTYYRSKEPLTLAAGNVSILASAFNLAGQDLPVSRTLILRHRLNDVSAYQAFRIAFGPPAND